MLFTRYVAEMQWRFLYVCLSLTFGIAIASKQVDYIFFILLEPLKAFSGTAALVSLDITEAFLSQVYLVVLVSIAATVPSFWLHLGLFLRPSLYRTELLKFQRIIAASFIFIVGSLYFSGFFLIPQAWSFFLSFSSLTKGTENTGCLDYLPGLWPYLNLIHQVVQVVLLTSQIPVLIFLLHTWGWLEIALFWKLRPWIILLALSWAAIISPPDLISQLLIFIPIFLTYESFVYTLFICRFVQASAISADA